MLKTFARKYRTSVSRIKARYVMKKTFMVEYTIKSGKRVATFYNGGFHRERLAINDARVSLLPQYTRYEKRNSFTNRIRLHKCELCEKTSGQLTFHQVKKLKELKGERAWERVMIERRRKTLVVCPDCYQQIHT